LLWEAEKVFGRIKRLDAGTPAEESRCDEILDLIRQAGLADGAGAVLCDVLSAALDVPTVDQISGRKPVPADEDEARWPYQVRNAEDYA